MVGDGDNSDEWWGVCMLLGRGGRPSLITITIL